MAESKIYKDDVGLIIDVDMGENISTATNLVFNIIKPDATTDTWSPSLQGTNYLRYTTSSGDLDQSGRYSLQPSLVLGGWTGKCTTVNFEVYDAHE